MLSLAFRPSVVELGRPNDVDLVVANAGQEDLYAIRLVARFPSWLRVNEGSRRIEIPTIDAGGQTTCHYVLTADHQPRATGRVPFPVVTFTDANGEAQRWSTDIALRVERGRERSGGIEAEVVFERRPVAGRWGEVRVLVRTTDAVDSAVLDIAFGGELDYDGPDRVAVGSGAASEIVGALRFRAAGTAVPVALEVTAMTGDGDYRDTEIRELVTVSDATDGDGTTHVYNIGKVEGNVGPGGSFVQNNVGGAVGRSSSDSIGGVEPEVLAAIQSMLTMAELSDARHADDRSTIEAFTKGEVEVGAARAAVRRVLDGTASIRSGLAANGLYEILRGFAMTQL